MHKGSYLHQSTPGCKNRLVLLVHVNICIEILKFSQSEQINSKARLAYCPKIFFHYLQKW